MNYRKINHLSPGAQLPFDDDSLGTNKLGGSGTAERPDSSLCRPDA